LLFDSSQLLLPAPVTTAAERLPVANQPQYWIRRGHATDSNVPQRP
jgi:hypothetical protein